MDRFRIVVGVWLTLLLPIAAIAHEGHVHAELEGAAPAAAVAITRSASSQRHEVVMRAPALRPKSEAKIDLYVSDWATNAPVTGATVMIELRPKERASDGTRLEAKPEAAGVYAAEMNLPETGDYNVLVTVRSGSGTDEFALASVRVEPAPPEARGAWPPLLLVAGAALSLVALILLAAFISRRWRARSAVGALMLLGLLGSAASAHEGHSHAAAEPEAVVTESEHVQMLKPSQFLLGVRTQVVRLERVPMQVSLLGRVAPRGGAEVEVVAPQGGRVDLANGRVPVLGEHIVRGQLLAHLVVVDSLAIRAPIGGVITGAHVVHGQRVEAGQKLVSLLDASTVWVHADVYERDLAAVERATRAIVTSDAWPGERFTGRRVALGATASELPGTIEGWFEVPNPRGKLRVGLPVSVAVELGGAELLTVLPRGAVLEDAGRATVWLHESPEEFASRRVEIVVRLGDRLAVRGLRDGERAVVAGAPAIAALPRVSEEH